MGINKSPGFAFLESVQISSISWLPLPERILPPVAFSISSKVILFIIHLFYCRQNFFSVVKMYFFLADKLIVFVAFTRHDYKLA